MNYYFDYVPYPNFSDDKYVYLKLEILCSAYSDSKLIEQKVMGKCSAILVKATSEKKAYFSYFYFYLYNPKEAKEKGIVVHKEEALNACKMISRAIGG